MVEVAESSVWRVGYLLVLRVALRDGSRYYEDALTGHRLPMVVVPDRATFVSEAWRDARPRLPAAAQDAISHDSTRQRGERQRQGIHIDLLVALRVHAVEHQFDLADLVAKVIPSQHHHQLFRHKVGHVFHRLPHTHHDDTPFQLAAIVTLPRFNDTISEQLNLIIEATTSQRGNWALTRPSSTRIKRYPMLVGCTDEHTIAGARDTQPGDVIVVNGTHAYAMTDDEPVLITTQNMTTKGIRGPATLRDLIRTTLMPQVVPGHVEAAQLIAAFSTLAAITGNTADVAVALIHHQHSKQFFSLSAANDLMRRCYVENHALAPELAYEYAQQQLSNLGQRWGATELADQLHTLANTMAQDLCQHQDEPLALQA